MHTSDTIRRAQHSTVPSAGGMGSTDGMEGDILQQLMKSLEDELQGAQAAGTDKAGVEAGAGPGVHVTSGPPGTSPTQEGTEPVPTARKRVLLQAKAPADKVLANYSVSRYTLACMARVFSKAGTTWDGDPMTQSTGSPFALDVTHPCHRAWLIPTPPL